MGTPRVGRHMLELPDRPGMHRHGHRARVFHHEVHLPEGRTMRPRLDEHRVAHPTLHPMMGVPGDDHVEGARGRRSAVVPATIRHARLARRHIPTVAGHVRQRHHDLSPIGPAALRPGAPAPRR